MKKNLLIIAALMMLSLFSCTKSTEDVVDGTPVTNITLSETDVTMLVGDQVKITYTLEPLDATDLNVTWESLDPSIVTVDETGVITAVASGQVTVLAKAANDVCATCSVVVEPETVFNKMIGHWRGYRFEWLDKVTGEIIPEEDYMKILPDHQSEEFYEATLELYRTQYTFDLNKDASMQIGILCVDMDYRYIPGIMTEAEAVNTFHGSFDFAGTRYEYLTELHELDFKYNPSKEDIRVHIVTEGDRYDIIRYYKVEKNTEN